jgi:DNA-binding transcriptional ArsR family regulator
MVVKLRGLENEQKLILNLLYELKNTIMIPPDPRLSCSGIAKTFGMKKTMISYHLEVLEEKGLVFPFRVGRKMFYRITVAGIYEVEKKFSNTIEGELSTSRIGIKSVRTRS